MIGIKDISYILGDTVVSNLDRMDRYDASESLILNKIGVKEIRKKNLEQETSDLVVSACHNLFEKGIVTPGQIDCLILVTQNPDGFGLPHISAIVHGKLNLQDSCACFDISLGCSGFVYGLSVITAFMNANQLENGLLITADNYSKIIDEDDRNTAMLFGDGVAVTLVGNDPKWHIGKFDFGTLGALSENLKINEKRRLYMNGREIFTFCAKKVPQSIEKVLRINEVEMDQIDKIILHQGSKYIVDTIGKRIRAVAKTDFYALKYGNTVSSSIPIALSSELSGDEDKILISGFGVGLSWATTILSKSKLTKFV